jgi:hypothetical protein
MLETTNVDQKNTIATSESEKSRKYEEARHKASKGDASAHTILL